MERLNRLIDKRHTNNYQIAKALKISEGTVRFWRKGRIPRADHLFALAEYLGVNARFILYGEKTYEPSIRDEAARIVDKMVSFGEKKPAELRRFGKMFDAYIGEGDEKGASVSETQEKRGYHKRKKSA